jgi:TPR repeat protein
MNEVPHYKEKALYWHQKAADGDYPKAEETIEDLCEWQREHPEKSILDAAGVWDDDEYYKRRLPEWTVVASSKAKAAAVDWYRDLATSGDSEAAFLCGLIFLCGIAVKKDDAQAPEWFRKAARRGHSTAKPHD